MSERLASCDKTEFSSADLDDAKMEPETRMVVFLEATPTLKGRYYC